MEEMNFSARTHDRSLKVTRTLTDLAGAVNIRPADVLKAIQWLFQGSYRRKQITRSKMRPPDQTGGLVSISIRALSVTHGPVTLRRANLLPL